MGLLKSGRCWSSDVISHVMRVNWFLDIRCDLSTEIFTEINLCTYLTRSDKVDELA